MSDIEVGDSGALEESQQTVSCSPAHSSLCLPSSLIIQIIHLIALFGSLI